MSQGFRNAEARKGGLATGSVVVRAWLFTHEALFRALIAPYALERFISGRCRRQRVRLAPGMAPQRAAFEAMVQTRLARVDTLRRDLLASEPRVY